MTFTKIQKSWLDAIRVCGWVKIDFASSVNFRISEVEWQVCVLLLSKHNKTSVNVAVHAPVWKVKGSKYPSGRSSQPEINLLKKNLTGAFFSWIISDLTLLIESSDFCSQDLCQDWLCRNRCRFSRNKQNNFLVNRGLIIRPSNWTCMLLDYFQAVERLKKTRLNWLFKLNEAQL